jgi:ATP-binding cassette subfamily B (MDR/TAP) protein 1
MLWYGMDLSRAHKPSIFSLDFFDYRGLGRKMGEGVQFCVTMIGGLVFGFWSSWRVSLLVLTVVAFMVASTSFLLKMNQTQTVRANSSYAKAGSIVYTAVLSIRTILALNAVEEMIAKFMKATQEAYDGAASQVIFVGLANGSVMGSFLLAYLPVTLYGAFLLYDNVRYHLKTESCNNFYFLVALLYE